MSPAKDVLTLSVIAAGVIAGALESAVFLVVPLLLDSCATFIHDFTKVVWSYWEGAFGAVSSYCQLPVHIYVLVGEQEDPFRSAKEAEEQIADRSFDLSATTTCSTGTQTTPELMPLATILDDEEGVVNGQARLEDSADEREVGPKAVRGAHAVRVNSFATEDCRSSPDPFSLP